MPLNPVAPRIAVALLAATLATGCASGGLRPGTGDISFRLTWSGRTDLDLYVLSPLGERVDFHFRKVESGGVLDVDCNARPDPTLAPVEESSWLCPVPTENVYWPRGDAPEGRFKYWVVMADSEGLEPGHDYRLEVRLGRSVVKQHRGSLDDLVDEPMRAEFDFQER
jgi:hypothetical protein